MREGSSRRRSNSALASLLALGAFGPPALCAGPPAAGDPAAGPAPVAAEQEAPEEEPELELVGPLTREEIEAALPDWVEAEIEAEPDPEAARALAGAGAGLEVEVFLGTWCSDSKRELARLWRALDETGGLAPFALEYVGVDREKAEPAERVAGLDLRFVPTIVVRREGRELGRLVEESPNGVEVDLLALLEGRVEGVVSARTDLDGEPE